ncbi:diacylglycerol kinase family protein [Dactylosporangium maewongense]|uniref:Diacylglycerol kinase family protein n=1 Tax=Dactylosporangium maewongense TaxID=634393 RepID=A0ABN1ZLU7_9ACTN
MERVAVVYNGRSGAFLGGDPPEERLVRRFGESGVTAQVRAFAPETLAADVEELLKGEPDAVFVAGGDGTVRAVAERMLGGDVPLGVLPAGTMNVLARDLGVPDDLDRAVGALLAAPVRRIDVATVNGVPFLCSSTLAMMPHLGRLREHARGRRGAGTVRLLGRGWRLLRRYPRLRLTIDVDGRVYEARTRAVVVSCNPLDAGPAPMPGRQRLDAGTLAVYVTDDRTGWDLLRVAGKLVRGTWQRDPGVHTYIGETVRVKTPALAMMSVMSDGEIAQLTVPLHYELRRRALAVLAPRDRP